MKKSVEFLYLIMQMGEASFEIAQRMEQLMTYQTNSDSGSCRMNKKV
jgi:hypothetical protein